MKTVTLSNRFYYHELDEKDASAIKNDLVLYNSMLHKAYKYLSLKNKGVYIKSSKIHKELKREFKTNDYFPLSCLWKAQHLLKANIEHHQLWLKQKKQQLKRIEMKIDEKQKKMNMRYHRKSYNRILSEFAYKEITETIKSRCRKEKVAYKEIDPAYTSRIAREKYMKPMGCSIHMAASYVIARRGCGYTEYI